jgi:hypothetical protein
MNTAHSARAGALPASSRPNPAISPALWRGLILILNFVARRARICEPDPWPGGCGRAR